MEYLALSSESDTSFYVTIRMYNMGGRKWIFRQTAIHHRGGILFGAGLYDALHRMMSGEFNLGLNAVYVARGELNALIYSSRAHVS